MHCQWQRVCFKGFSRLLSERGIKCEIIAPYNPPQSGIVKQMNRTIHKKIKSILSHATFLDGFLTKVVATIVHLINKSLSKFLEKEVTAKMVWSSKSLCQIF